VGDIDFLSVLNDGPVVLKIVCIIIILLNVLLNERARPVKFAIDGLYGYLGAIVLRSISMWCDTLGVFVY
jgi:hypothetical protein